MERNENLHAAREGNGALYVSNTPEKWRLALFCLLLGVLFERLVLMAKTDDVSGWYALFFVLCASAVIALNFERFRRARDAKICAGTLLLLGALYAFHPNRAFEVLGGYNLLAVPALAMLTAVLTVRDYPEKREGALCLDFLYSWTVGACSAVPLFFGAIVRWAAGAEKSRRKSALLGVAVAIPVLAAVLMLLARADHNMSRLISKLIFHADIATLLFRLALTVLTGMLTYSAIYNLTWREKKPLKAQQEADWPAVTVGVALVLLIAVYAVFGGLQFSYLFSGTLPTEYTYSEYARAGFSELLWVAAINFSLFGITLRYVKKGRVIRVLAGILLILTAVLLVSAAGRLLLYIGAYKLTVNRILPLWLMVYMAYELALCGVRMKRESMPLLNLSAKSFLLWYLLLNLPDWARLIQTYNGL